MAVPRRIRASAKILGVLVRNTHDAQRLQERVDKDREKFACLPASIIPLSIICQGLLAPQ